MHFIVINIYHLVVLHFSGGEVMVFFISLFRKYNSKNSDKESAETPTETLDLVEDSKKLNETSIDQEPSKN